MEKLTSPIGLIAGSGNFPKEFLRAAKELNLDVVVAAYKSECDPSIADDCKSISWVSVGQLARIIKLFKKNKVKQISILGGIKRARLFRELWPDWRAIKLIARLPSLKDDCVLRGLAEELEQDGFSVFSASEVLIDSVAKAGLLTQRDFTVQERSDAQLAWQAAKAIGALDIGQAAVAYKRTVVALEAVEGTDKMLERVAELIKPDSVKEAGAVLVKVAKPGQDLRLDLPAVGQATLENMKKAGVTALVLEAGKALISAPAEFIAQANAEGIVVCAWNENS